MSDLYQNPEQRPAAYLAPDTSIRPDASDFIEQPDMEVIPPQRESLPVWLYIICGIALFLAGSSYTGIQFGPGYYDQGEGAPVGPTHDDLATTTQADDPMSIGKRLYNGNCANCHQASGAGQPGAYPPMVGSEWVLGSKQTLASILLDGVTGPLNVHGGAYGTNVMPAWANISDSNLAAIMTYIRKSWGNGADEVKPADVTPVRTKDASRSTPWTEPDLTKMNSSGGK